MKTNVHIPDTPAAKAAFIYSIQRSPRVMTWYEFSTWYNRYFSRDHTIEEKWLTKKSFDKLVVVFEHYIPKVEAEALRRHSLAQIDTL